MPCIRLLEPRMLDLTIGDRDLARTGSALQSAIGAIYVGMSWLFYAASNCKSKAAKMAHSRRRVKTEVKRSSAYFYSSPDRCFRCNSAARFCFAYPETQVLVCQRKTKEHIILS